MNFSISKCFLSETAWLYVCMQLIAMDIADVDGGEPCIFGHALNIWLYKITFIVNNTDMWCLP